MCTERPAGGCNNDTFKFTVQVSLTEVPSVIGLAGLIVRVTDEIDESAKFKNISLAKTLL